jgi:hypothetical protein
MNASSHVQSYLPYAVMPVWLGADVADWLRHRRHAEAIP